MARNTVSRKNKSAVTRKSRPVARKKATVSRRKSVEGRGKKMGIMETVSKSLKKAVGGSSR